MTGIKDGISGGLSSQDNSDTGLSEGNFISIDEVTTNTLGISNVSLKNKDSFFIKDGLVDFDTNSITTNNYFKQIPAKLTCWWYRALV